MYVKRRGSASSEESGDMHNMHIGPTRRREGQRKSRAGGDRMGLILASLGVGLVGPAPLGLVAPLGVVAPVVLRWRRRRVHRGVSMVLLPEVGVRVTVGGSVGTGAAAGSRNLAVLHDPGGGVGDGVLDHSRGVGHGQGHRTGAPAIVSESRRNGFGRCAAVLSVAIGIGVGRGVRNGVVQGEYGTSHSSSASTSTEDDWTGPGRGLSLGLGGSVVLPLVLELIGGGDTRCAEGSDDGEAGDLVTDHRNLVFLRCCLTVEPGLCLFRSCATRCSVFLRGGGVQGME
mmetsp:Transcript_10184/g.28803  ORF Transcript_10184/g.28803 Transcript_10184/m.28803 type:complete len:286 (-) Transcript_10184:1267-2124(-)